MCMHTWRFMGISKLKVISGVTIITTHIKGLITPLLPYNYA